MSKSTKRYLMRDKDEFFATPDYIRDDLYELIPENVKTILDPCCGSGALEVEGYDYALYDLVDRGYPNVTFCDFLQKPYEGERYDAVVINPPFCLLDEFVERCFLYTDNIFIVSPFRVLKKWSANVKAINYKRYHQGFSDNVKTVVSCFHLSKNEGLGKTEAEWKSELFIPKMDELRYHTKHYTVADADPTKWCVWNVSVGSFRHQGLKARGFLPVPMTEEVFECRTTNNVVRRGQILERDMVVFDTKEEAEAFRKVYTENFDFIKDYVYDRLCMMYANVPFLDWSGNDKKDL